MDMKRLIVGISGASGAIYGVRLLQVLRDVAGVETHLVMSNAARQTLALETDLARASWDRATSRNRELTFNPLSREQVLALPQGKLLSRFVDRLGAKGEKEVLAYEMPPSAEEAESLKLSAETLARIGGGIPETMRIIGTTPIATS